MDAKDARSRALQIEPHDAAQRAITEAALREVGEGVVTVREVPIEERPFLLRIDGGWQRDENGKRKRAPRWQAFRNGNPIMFAGLVYYGGATREEALREARRIASKWGWPVDAEAA
jgi:hypothetical protein